MKKNYLIKNKQPHVLTIRKNNYLMDGFNYTTENNTIIVNSYTGSNPNPILTTSEINYFTLIIPSIYKVDVDNYTYTYSNEIVTLTKYNGASTDVDTPELVET